MKKTIREIRYNYKVWWFNPLKQKKVLTSYSNKYKIEEDAKSWYEEYGRDLEIQFNRE